MATATTLWGRMVANGGGRSKGSTWKNKQCKECGKGDHWKIGKLNDEQLHDKCVAKYNTKQMAKKENDGFTPVWRPGELPVVAKRQT